jgi:lysozyme
MIIPPVPQAAIDTIKRFEGLRLARYDDVDGNGTIGYGHLCKPGDHLNVITEDTANNLLHDDSLLAAASVIRLSSTPLNDNQYSALIDFVFNMGAGSYQRSTLRQKINRREFNDIYQELNKWVYGNGRKIPGLVTRRKAEFSLFMQT